MGQYRLWLHHRAIDQNLQGQHITYKQELSEIDEQIARIEKTAMPTNNALLVVLMQQLKLQEHTTYKKKDAKRAQLEENEILQEKAHNPKYQTPPPSNYGQLGKNLPMADPRLAPPPLYISPALLAWSHLPNFAAQDIHISEEVSVDAISPLPEATEHLLPSDLHILLDQEHQKNGQLPWWLRNLMDSHEEQEPQQMTSIDQQSIHTNQRVEHWFARRTRLVHLDE